MDWQNEKKRILSLKLEEKRKLYRCGANFTTVRTLRTWADQAQEDEIRNYVVDQDKLFEKFDPDPRINSRVSLWRGGDITTLEIDGIVNAANSKLEDGNGVNGAIHDAAGPYLAEECSSLNGCMTGHSKITGGYNLPAKYVIHTVGPKEERPEELKSSYQNSLNLMLENNLREIAFPCISTGIYGYPNEPAAHLALRTTRIFLQRNQDKVGRVVFVLFLEKDFEIYAKLAHLYFPSS